MTKTTVSDDVINAIRGLIGNPYMPFENEPMQFVLQMFLHRVVQIPGSLSIHWNVIIFTGWSLPNLHKYILSPYICQKDFYNRSKKKSKLFFIVDIDHIECRRFSSCAYITKYSHNNKFNSKIIFWKDIPFGAMHSELAGWAYFKDLICKYYTYIYNLTYITIFLGYFQMVYTKIIKWTIYIIQFILFNYFFRIFFFKSREGSLISWG